MPENPLLAPIDTLIDYQSLKPAHIVPAVEALIRLNTDLIHEKCQIESPTWDNFVKPLDIAGERLSRAINVASHLQGVRNTPEIREAYNEILPKISAFSSWTALSVELYRQYERIHQSDAFSELTPERQRIITETLKEFRLNGINLDDDAKSRRAEINEQLSQLSQKFSLNVLDATDAWSYTETQEEELSGLPEDAKAAARKLAEEHGREGWEFTVQMPSLIPVLAYADSPKLRERLYRAYNTLASELGDARYDNSLVMKQILALRLEKSQQVGFSNYAALMLENRMADDTTQVLDFLRDVADRAKPFAEKELAELKTFAATHLNLPELKPWDHSYVSEKLKQHLFRFTEEEIKQYLPQDKVLEGLFRLIETLFSVQFKALSDVPVWHEHVRVFALQDGGKTIGYLYTDLYARQGKQNGAWVAPERSRQVIDGEVVLPAANLVCNFAEPLAGQPALLRHDDLITLFHEMGHALHELLTKVDEPAAAGISGVEWDAVELPSQFMENFCWEWSVMSGMTAHAQTGEPMPQALFDKLHRAKNFHSGLTTLRQIEFALFDMLLHTAETAPDAEQIMSLLQAVRKEVAVVSSPEWGRFPHHFSHIFAGGYAAGYYSYKWAEVLSADAFSYFEEHADQAHGAVNPASGAHFKKEILEVGSSLPAKTFFRNFRGRDPRPDALLRHNGMQDSSERELQMAAP